MFTPIVPHGNNNSSPETTTTAITKFHHSNKEISTSKSFPGQQQLQGQQLTPQSNKMKSSSGTFHGRKFIEQQPATATATSQSQQQQQSPRENKQQSNPILSSNSTSSQQEVSARIRSKKLNSNLNDLDKLLDNDAVALLNMRKDLSSAQETEVTKARSLLLTLQKEYDNLQINNQQKESSVSKLSDEKIVLINLIHNQTQNREVYTDKINFLQDDIQAIEESILSENRTKGMMSYMIKRLETEILECKSNSHHWSQQLQQIKAELNGLDGTLRLSKHELTNEEKEVEVLSKTIQGRTEQRLHKMNELQSLVLEGEASVMKIKNTWQGSNEGSPRKGGESSLELYPKSENQKVADDQDLTHPQPEYELTKEQIREIIERYNSRHPLMEKLNSIQSDLNNQIKEEKLKKTNFEDLLEKSNQKLQLLASNRQIYQEVDMKDAALTSARKEGDDCRERDQRLRKGIEGLRRSIPRFLQKVNKELIPDGGKPVTVDQLPDVVHKLDDEISKLIKLIGERMLKDATAEDISNMSTSVQEYNNMQTAETTSETSRLHKLPGYHRLEKQLFFNLMSAVPDSSEKNIRIQPVKLTESNELDHHRVGMNSQEGDPGVGAKRGAGVAGGGAGGGGAGTGFLMSNTTGNDYIDRTTVKSISKLVVTQKEKSLQVTSTNSRYGKRNPTILRSR